MKIHINLILKFFLCALLLIGFQGCASHANYPVTRLVGWAPAENVKWEVLHLSAEFEDQNFDLYNSTSHILIKARIKVFGHVTSTYKIKKLHISQRTIREDLRTVVPIKITAPGNPPKPNELFIKQYRDQQQTGTIPFTVIEVTPVLELNQRFIKAEAAEFDLIIEEPIQNRGYGRNYYRVKLGGQQIDLGTYQSR